MLKSPQARRILQRVVCPHCWETFTPDQILFVSEHQDLVGDPLLGERQQQRFPATRFNLAGDAIDARGMICRTLACPNCHLPITRASLEMETFFLSILGSPSSGKSYLLAAMMSQLRRVLPFHFGVTLTDVDLETNRILNQNEGQLMLNGEADQFQPLSSLITKTDEQGELYDEVSFGHQAVRLPRPFLFALYPQPGHPNGGRADAYSRLLCLYDNAGESFEPGKDEKRTPVTRHLAQSRALLFVFDPTQDQRFRHALKTRGAEMKMGGSERLRRQEIILNEAAARVRRHAGLAQSEKHDRPLIVVVTKFDQWTRLFPVDDISSPWRSPKRGAHENAVTAGLDVERIARSSLRLRSLLVEYCPEIVAAAEGFATSVTYVPVSALGPHVEIDSKTSEIGIRPSRIKPFWVTVPFLYALTKVLPGLIPRLKRRPQYR